METAEIDQPFAAIDRCVALHGASKLVELPLRLPPKLRHTALLPQRLNARPFCPALKFLGMPCIEDLEYSITGGAAFPGSVAPSEALPSEQPHRSWSCRWLHITAARWQMRMRDCSHCSARNSWSHVREELYTGL